MIFVKSKVPNISNNLVVLHGLGGSPQGFASIVKNPKISNQVNSHLLNWHMSPYDIQSQTNALKKYLTEDVSNEQICLLGHSMGAKIIMATLSEHSRALQDKIAGIVILDMLPFSLQNLDIQNKDKVGSGEMKSYLEAFQGLDLKVRSTEEIMNLVAQASPQKRVQDLIASNIDFEQKQWKINIDEIIRNYDSFINYRTQNKWPGKTLVLYGENSSFVKKEQISSYSDVFEGIDLEKDVKMIPNAGHWIQADQPTIFINELSKFMKIVF